MPKNNSRQEWFNIYNLRILQFSTVLQQKEKFKSSKALKPYIFPFCLAFFPGFLIYEENYKNNRDTTSTSHQSNQKFFPKRRYKFKSQMDV